MVKGIDGGKWITPEQALDEFRIDQERLSNLVESGDVDVMFLEQKNGEQGYYLRADIRRNFQVRDKSVENAGRIKEATIAGGIGAAVAKAFDLVENALGELNEPTEKIAPQGSSTSNANLVDSERLVVVCGLREFLQCENQVNYLRNSIGNDWDRVARGLAVPLRLGAKVIHSCRRIQVSGVGGPPIPYLIYATGVGQKHGS